MEKETAKYIVTYFSSLLSKTEKVALKHHSSILKLEENENPKLREIYKQKGWITDDPEILDLLKNGYNKFEINTAERAFEKYHEKIFLNNCSKCGKLARTPYAKQCRICGFNWRN